MLADTRAFDQGLFERLRARLADPLAGSKEAF
jgi:hypothetical protein